MASDYDDSTYADIDPHKLDEEWMDQPRRFGVFAKRLATAKKRLEEARQYHELIKAELDLEIRSEPEKHGIKRVSEKAIESVIIQHSRFRKTQKKLNIKRHTVDILQAAVNALNHRKTSLENLVDLYGMDYFSSPRASRDNQEAVETAKARLRHRKGHRKRRDKQRKEDDD